MDFGTLLLQSGFPSCFRDPSVLVAADSRRKPQGVADWCLGRPCQWVQSPIETTSRAEKRKAYTTTAERKSFGELFWPQRTTFQAGGGYKNPIQKPRKPYLPPKSFLCGPYFFAKKSSSLEQGGVCSLFQETRKAFFVHFFPLQACLISVLFPWQPMPLTKGVELRRGNSKWTQENKWFWSSPHP